MTGPIPYTAYTKDQWQNLLQQAIHAHDYQMVGVINGALKQYDQQDVPPTTGELLNAEGHGLASVPGNMLKGTGQVLGDLATGHPMQAASDVVQGTISGVKGTLGLPATALKMAGQSLLGEPVDTPSRDELGREATAYGASALPTGMAAAGAVRLAPTIARAATAIPRSMGGAVARGFMGALKPGAEAAPAAGPTLEGASQFGGPAFLGPQTPPSGAGIPEPPAGAAPTSTGPTLPGASRFGGPAFLGPKDWPTPQVATPPAPAPAGPPGPTVAGYQSPISSVAQLSKPAIDPRLGQDMYAGLASTAEPPEVTAFKQLSPSDAQLAFSRSTPQMQQLLAPYMRQKMVGNIVNSGGPQ